MQYTLTDWLIDCHDHRACVACGHFSLEIMGSHEAQCYKCNRWYDIYDLGRGESELLHLSTSYLREQKQKGPYGQSYEAMRFEDRCAEHPEPIEIPVDPSFLES